MKFRPLPCEVHHNAPCRIRVWSAHFRLTPGHRSADRVPRCNEEALMRPPFFMDKLEPSERATIKRWQTYVGGFYSALAVLVVAFIVVKTDRVQTHMAKLTAANEAVAAER